MSRSRPPQRFAGIGADPLRVTLALVVALVATALVVLTISAGAQASSRDQLAPVHGALSAGIAHRYIVVLKGRLPSQPTKRSERKARAEAKKVASSVNATPLFVYEADIKGFAAHLTRPQLRALRHDPRVKYVEHDARVKETVTQTAAPWNLDRIDQQHLPLDGTYEYSPPQGAGVHVYIIDTGLQADHPDFGSRASFGVNTVDSTNTPCDGHGTHVAGIAGGTVYGVAKLVKLVDVKVMNCHGDGTWSSVIAGVDWVTEHHVAGKSVANMSLGGGANTATDAAVNHLIESGVFVSVAAGNRHALAPLGNACNESPARVPTAFTVAASDQNDGWASFSNHGPCVDAYAPGVQITSDWIGGGTDTISGTSMAAPAVAGTAALLLSHRAHTPAATTAWLITNLLFGVIRNNPSGTANRLLYKSAL
jgi:subtilisin family serine protease